jgi:hypothetical protein
VYRISNVENKFGRDQRVWGLAGSLTCWAGLSLYINKMGSQIINANFRLKQG